MFCLRSIENLCYLILFFFFFCSGNLFTEILKRRDPEQQQQLQLGSSTPSFNSSFNSSFSSSPHYPLVSPRKAEVVDQIVVAYRKVCWWAVFVFAFWEKHIDNIKQTI